MKSIFSVVVTLLFFSSAQANLTEPSARQVLLETYNISMITDTCVDEGYEITSHFPCYGDSIVEDFAQLVLKKVAAVRLTPWASTIEFRLTEALPFCIHSHQIINAMSLTRANVFKVQHCNIDKTIQSLLPLNSAESAVAELKN